MKIEVLKQDGNVFYVKLTPNFVGKLFGKEEKTIKVIDTGNVYVNNEKPELIDEDGYQIYRHGDLYDAVIAFTRKQMYFNPKK